MNNTFGRPLSKNSQFSANYGLGPLNSLPGLVSGLPIGHQLVSRFQEVFPHVPTSLGCAPIKAAIREAFDD